MNKQKILSSLILIVFIAVISVTFYSFGTNNNDKENNIELAVDPQIVHSLQIPETIEFADTILPVTRFDIRERLDRELMAFTYMHSTTIILIKRANLYFPIIEPILKEHGVPDDFKYLALIESYFNPLALSPVKAAGIWQFMEETAKTYGLEINMHVDERLNLEKATVAACNYLKDSYEIYGDWSIVAASYNGGRERMTRQLEIQKTFSFYDMFLNEETRRYVYRIIAAKEVISNPRKYGFILRKQDFYHTVRVKEVEVKEVENWVDWSIEQGITYGQLKFFNPWIQDLKLINKTGKVYTVKIPYKEDLNFDIDKVIIHNKNWIR
ncbi:MAG: lytic transglycosylase domain-containing protein [Bacteroidales bacterium]|jgi:hypothetical protein|nr:lytic transglycosylase domain-containing protein [Bacteroidales bacterium]